MSTYWKPLQFRVPGEPRGKGRPRFTRTGHTYPDDKTAAYENLIRLAFDKQFPAWDPTEGAVKIDIIARFPAPKSWSKKKTAMAYADEIHKTTKPDADNIVKAVLDGLNGTAWSDDSQVIDQRCRKDYYPAGELLVTIWVEEEEEEDE